MITRPSSLVREYDEYVSIDPSFVQAPEPPPENAAPEVIEAYAKELADYAAKVSSARETGDWQSMLIDGAKTPTKFVMRQVDRNIAREISDRVELDPDNPRRIGNNVGFCLLFRLAIVRIVGGPEGAEGKIERAKDPRWDDWVMATPSVVNALDEIDRRIVTELGRTVFQRIRGSPK